MVQRNDIRWGDSQGVHVNASVIMQVRQLVNVEAPHPCSWSVGLQVTGHTIAQALLVAMNMRLGVGSVMVNSPMVFGPLATAPFSSFFTVPAQTIAIDVQLFSPIGDFDCDVAVWVAPFIPWAGLDVDAIGERVYVEDPYR